MRYYQAPSWRSRRRRCAARRSAMAGCRFIVAAACVLFLLLLLQRLSGHTTDVVVVSTGPDSARPDSRMRDLIAHGQCGRLFIDGGSNTGESVAAFVAGNYFECAMSAPYRVYRSAWKDLSVAARRQVMAPLREPRSWCVRSFEAAPELLPPLRDQERKLRADGFDVTFVDGALGNATAGAAPREVVTYSRHPSGASAVSMAFEDIHAEGKPAALSSRVVRGPSYDVRQLLRRTLALNASAVVALRLDIEGGEWWVIEALLADDLLCSVSYMFVEFHGSATEAQRLKLPRYGIATEAFERLKARVHKAMERPGCRLQIYWRSFWASCGDRQRFEWRDLPQATQTSGQD